MNCKKVLDLAYEHEKMPLIMRIRIGLHLLVCPGCAREIERLEVGREVLRNDFFPSSPGIEDTIMAMIAAEEEAVEALEARVRSGFSTKGWVIAGVVLLVSLVTAFFSLDFHHIVHDSGMSFVIPISITIGIILTSYGLVFIGSHLKELTERFGLKA